MKTAIFSLIGVVIGALLSTAKDWWFESRRHKKDLAYLSIHVVCIFDHFVAGCIDITRDDGLSYGQRDSDGCKVPQVAHPSIDFKSIDVEWKSLTSELMYEILNFPTLIDEANSYIEHTTEFAAGPPDYEEYFETRIIKYSELGLKAIEISTQLRKISKLPDATEYDEYLSRKEILTMANDSVKEIIEHRETRQKELVNKLKNA